MNKVGYQCSYEYFNTKTNKVVHVYECSVYKTYREADERLSIELDRIQKEGHTNVQGSVEEIEY